MDGAKLFEEFILDNEVKIETSPWAMNAEDSEDDSEWSEKYPAYNPYEDESVPRTFSGVCFVNIEAWEKQQSTRISTGSEYNVAQTKQSFRKRKRGKKCSRKRSSAKRRRKAATVTSQYRGVVWDGRNRKWRAQLSYLSKKSYLGLYVTDNDAAMVVNWKCDEMGIERYNPALGVMVPRYRSKGKKRSVKKPEEQGVMKFSSWRGVVWDKSKGKWKAEFISLKEKHFIGHFEDEKDAALAVNWQCDVLKIPRKNRKLPAVNSLVKNENESNSPKLHEANLEEIPCFAQVTRNQVGIKQHNVSAPPFAEVEQAKLRMSKASCNAEVKQAKPIEAKRILSWMKYSNTTNTWETPSTKEFGKTPTRSNSGPLQSGTLVS